MSASRVLIVRGCAIDARALTGRCVPPGREAPAGICAHDNEGFNGSSQRVDSVRNSSQCASELRGVDEGHGDSAGPCLGSYVACKPRRGRCQAARSTTSLRLSVSVRARASADGSPAAAPRRVSRGLAARRPAGGALTGSQWPRALSSRRAGPRRPAGGRAGGRCSRLSGSHCTSPPHHRSGGCGPAPPQCGAYSPGPSFPTGESADSEWSCGSFIAS